MKKSIAFTLFLFALLSGFAQGKMTITDSFSVKGQVKNQVIFTVNTLDTFKTRSLHDVTTVNHMGKPMATIKNAKGILLRDVLNSISLSDASPKKSFGYYLECIGSDGFKVVFSWDEILNTLDGDNTYIITEKDGKKLNSLDDRIAILMMYDGTRGHIYLKGLQQINVRSVNDQ